MKRALKKFKEFAATCEDCDWSGRSMNKDGILESIEAHIDLMTENGDFPNTFHTVVLQRRVLYKSDIV